MDINIFEGARRIGKAILLLIAAIGIWAALEGGWDDLAQVAGITAACLVGFHIFFWVIGWVVRGFMGISMGRDSR